jgi:hypothetical protein
MTEKQRTDQQRKAIEVMCREYAFYLNAAGLEQRAVFAKMRDGVDIPWSQETVKENLLKPIVKAMFDKDSTADLETDQVSKVYETLNRWTSEKLGVSVEFPDRHGPMVG